MLESEPEVRLQDRRRLAFQPGQIVHEVVHGGELARVGVLQNPVEPAGFGFAAEERDAHGLGFPHLRRHFGQHRGAARHMEAADGYRETGRQKRPRQVDRASKLVRLNADEADQRAAARLAHHPDDLVRPYPPVGFIIGVQPHLDVGTEHLPRARVLRQAVEAGERIGGDRRTNPLNRVAVIVVMGRLDHYEVKQRRGAGRALNPHHSSLARFDPLAATPRPLAAKHRDTSTDP
jgi:hypothetical protein